LAFILGKITHHIHPTIVDYIALKNLEFKEIFSSFAHNSLDLSPFFYEESDCIFPGYRRPVNKEKTEKWKNNVYEVDKTILNDNTFPRHIWAYLSVNRAYSGGSNGIWSPSGLDRFELAHVFGHKVAERELEQEAFENYQENIKPYGLFTSASNIVLIPKGFAKPTDDMRIIKLCFYKRHIDLYGENLPGLKSFKEGLLPQWYSEISWLEPELPVDWRDKIDSLLSYRAKHLKEKYAKT
jgi:hypothetical protein